MKFIKYFFLFLLIAIVALAIYLATLDGTYEVERKSSIQADPIVVFNELNEYRNWEDWGPWFETDSTMQVTYGAKTSGVGASYSWTGEEGSGEMHTVEVKDAERIDQEILFHTPFGEMPASVYWDMVKTESGTKLSWGIRGEMPFFTRFMADGMEEQMGPMLERGLELFGKNLDQKLSTYSIDSLGVVDYSGGFYLYLTASSRIADMNEKLPVMMQQVASYAKDKGIRLTGSPFAIYHKFDEVNGTTMFSVAYPVAERIITEDGSDILTGFMERGTYFKTVLKGSYAFSEEAWTRAMQDAASLRDYVPVENGEPFEIYVNNPVITPNPAELVTEIFVPVVVER